MDLLKKIRWISIPSGTVFVGSTLEEINAANLYWRDHLLNEEYKEKFHDWLMKEYPSHPVHLHCFRISETVVTNELYSQFCEDTGYVEPESLYNYQLGGGLDHPVWGVSINDALNFTHWLSKKMQVRITLPSEAQWEYAARGSTKRQYPWGNYFSAVKCNTIESNVNRTTPVTKYKNGKSFFGLFDMGGNVEEWVLTKYRPYLKGKIIRDDLIEKLGKGYFILKGGSFARGGDLSRISRRHGRHPDPTFRFTGFRLVIN